MEDQNGPHLQRWLVADWLVGFDPPDSVACLVEVEIDPFGLAACLAEAANLAVETAPFDEVAYLVEVACLVEPLPFLELQEVVELV